MVVCGMNIKEIKVPGCSKSSWEEGMLRISCESRISLMVNGTGHRGEPNLTWTWPSISVLGANNEFKVINVNRVIDNTCMF